MSLLGEELMGRSWWVRRGDEAVGDCGGDEDRVQTQFPTGHTGMSFAQTAGRRRELERMRERKKERKKEKQKEKKKERQI